MQTPTQVIEVTLFYDGNAADILKISEACVDAIIMTLFTNTIVADTIMPESTAVRMHFVPSKPGSRLAPSEASGSHNEIYTKLPGTSLFELSRRNCSPCLSIFQINIRNHEVVQGLPGILRGFNVLVLDVHSVCAEPRNLHTCCKRSARH